MKPVIWELEERISEAMREYAQIPGACPAIVRPATDPKFGDYQVNGIMGLAKKIKADPVATAQAVANSLDLNEFCTSWNVAGPGFINLELKAEFVARRMLEINEDVSGLAVEKAKIPRTVVVDFSSPNIAKQMHVGHLRSTIIGDATCRILEFLGHKVIRQNHIGDWGTPMGMLLVIVEELQSKFIQNIENLEKFNPESPLPAPIPLEEIEQLYKDANKRFEVDSQFAAKAKKYTYNLQRGIVNTWWHIRNISLSSCQKIYDTLDVKLNIEHVRGESFYKNLLVDVVDDLKKAGIAIESDGAICVFPDGFKNKDGQSLPLIIEKSDGAFLYATTDLAALRYRVDELGADAIVYVTDARQKLHFEMLFAVARMAGWASEDVELSHVMFGSVLGAGGAPLKTREGENVKLKELLDEAVERANAVVEEKNPGLPAEKKAEIAKAVGIGAVKYADFSNNRTSDYIFSFDKMLAMEGNTAPYMQYAYARIKSIERKAQSRDVDIETELTGLKALSLSDPAELDLAKYLIRYGEAIQAAAADYRPNYLTSYLYELAQKFSAFYTNCPVLDAGPDKRPTRLLLCDLTARVIGHGLSELLGIGVVEQM
ncbi:MAG: arginine--tRNA ligase [Planctomycetes bacterium]|nr:arginine--tRNA ligase [Planctomycetota bacterium]